MVQSLLSIRPIKDFPNMLIYLKRVNKIMEPEQMEYVMFSTKTGKFEGEMLCHKTEMNFRDDYNGNTLAIDLLKAKHRKQGVGGAFINFAKYLSKQTGCNGYIILKADPFFTPDSAPHIFYRKCSFSTLDTKQDKKIDTYVKKHKDANWKDMLPTLMFYPPKQQVRKQSLFEKILNFIRA